MAADRLPFLDPVALRSIYPGALHSEFLFRSPSNLFTNVQFIPERVSQFSISPDGIRYYKVHWQETWLAEHQLLPYQNLIEHFWRSQNNLNTTAQPSSSPSTPIDLIKPRKETTNNESFLNALQSETVEYSSQRADIAKTTHVTTIPTMHLNKPLNITSNQETISHIQSRTDLLTEAVITSDLANDMDLDLTTSNASQSTLDVSSQESNIKFISPGVKKPGKSRTIKLEGFDLVNIENRIASVEELESQARETLGSFRRKRVRFPNGTSKLPQTCFFCLKTISNRKKLREHQFGVHFKNVGEFLCGICQQRFVFRRQLKAHMITHSDNRNYVCKICGLTCKRRSHLHKHMDTHKKERNYRCDVCHKNFKVQAELKDHCLEEHKNQVSKCNVCKQTLHTPFSVYIHSMRHSGTRDHICETCGRSFKRKQHLSAHVVIHNSDLKGKIKCPACDKEFPERQYFRKHLEVYHKDLVDTYKYDYVCHICKKDFAYKGRLDAHMKLHENETQEEREARAKKGKVDTISDEMLENLKDKIEKVVDEKSGYVLMRCKLCTKREFRMISSMERHLQDHDSGRVFMKATGSYKCEICKKTFYSEARLTRHSAVHQAKTKQKLHQCKKCKKSFKWKSCLQAHVKKCQPPINKGAEKRKATLKAKEKLRKTLQRIKKANNDDFVESDASSVELNFKRTTKTRGSDNSSLKENFTEDNSDGKLVLKFKLSSQSDEDNENRVTLVGGNIEESGEKVVGTSLLRSQTIIDEDEISGRIPREVDETTHKTGEIEIPRVDNKGMVVSPSKVLLQSAEITNSNATLAVKITEDELSLSPSSVNNAVVTESTAQHHAHHLHSATISEPVVEESNIQTPSVVTLPISIDTEQSDN